MIRSFISKFPFNSLDGGYRIAVHSGDLEQAAWLHQPTPAFQLNPVSGRSIEGAFRTLEKDRSSSSPNRLLRRFVVEKAARSISFEAPLPTRAALPPGPSGEVLEGGDQFFRRGSLREISSLIRPRTSMHNSVGAW